MQPDAGRPAPLRIVVVDADDRVRESLAGLLGIDDRLEVVGGAGRIGPALELVTVARPDIVIVDPRLPDEDGGRAFIHQLRATSPDTRIVVMCLAGAIDGADLADLCDGVVRKTFRPSDLITAIFAASTPATP